MHKPDPKLPSDQQDKRSLIPLEPHDFDRWLTCTVEEAKEMLKVPAVELFAAHPFDEEDSSTAVRVPLT
jgi:putative SOS response-associated peptidase YedK